MIESVKNFLKKIAPKSAVDLSIDSGCRIINGSFQVSQCTVNEKLKINGAATLGQHTIVKKLITVNGQFEATGTTFEDDLFVNGTTDIKSSTLKRKAHFSGNLTARDCHFTNSIILLAHDASFINCQIDDIIIHGLPYVKAPQKIRLFKGCEVSGDITFESKNGEVWVEKSSQIHGNVNGGKII